MPLVGRLRRQVLHHLIQLAGVGTGGEQPALRPAQADAGHGLHGPRDLLDVLRTRDASPDFAK